MAGGFGDAIHLDDLNDIVAWRSIPPKVLENGAVVPMPELPPEEYWVDRGSGPTQGDDPFRLYLNTVGGAPRG